MNFKLNVAAFLEALLEKKGWKKADLSKKLGISQGRLTQYLKAQELPRAETLINISEIGNTTLDELLKGSDRPILFKRPNETIEIQNDLERECVKKLLRILRSDDDLMKGAIIPNINAFEDRLIEKKGKKKKTDPFGGE